MKNTKTYIISFLSGTLMLFLLSIAGIFLYATIGSMQGWEPVHLSLLDILVFDIQIQNQSFEMKFGIGLILVALLGGLLNLMLSIFLNRKNVPS